VEGDAEMLVFQPCQREPLCLITDGGDDDAIGSGSHMPELKIAGCVCAAGELTG